jgi:hypothetical protein
VGSGARRGRAARGARARGRRQIAVTAEARATERAADATVPEPDFIVTARGLAELFVRLP